MSQAPASIVYKNVLPWRACEKLYLSAQTADVFFVFESDDGDTVKIPAHKSILSANSEVFYAMFHGPAKQNGDIPIVNSTPEAFTEFLQFFYLATVKLTPNNKFNVMNLGKQYLVDDCCMATSRIFEQTLSLDNVCQGYEMAILFNQAQLVKIYEQKISENPKRVFQSKSFLSCGPNVLAHILQLESLDCDESVVFDGCIAWAKAACIRNGLDESNMPNLRNQLGDLFFEIRFGEMTTEKFYPRYRAYDKLFTTEEFKDIIGMIASKLYRPPKFNRNARKTSQRLPRNANQLICNRNDPLACFEHTRYDVAYCRSDNIFSSNCALTLTTIHCTELFYYTASPNIVIMTANVIPALMEVMELSNQRPSICGQFIEVDKKTIYSDQVIFQSTHETIVNLSSPIAIRAGFKYNIVFTVRLNGCYTLLTLKSKVELEQGIQIEFHNMNGYHSNNRSKRIQSTNNQGLVKQLIFGKFEA